ncbi:MAG: aminotransferase class V-fold PLP-dependent enzyme, partial [Pseudomonadota bacterium]|nr:aminotransferase class V-fold PLP-dependent enzyme [Pseudomonadota bacterium]
GVGAAGGVVIAGDALRIATIGAVALPNASAAGLVVQLDLAGIAISAGSACSSGSMKASRVLSAMSVAPQLAASSIRVSFGAETSKADVDAFLAAFTAIAQRQRAA